MIGSQHFATRYGKFLRQLETHRLDAFLVSHPPHLAYLFNFTGSAGFALCVDGQTQLLVDSRYLTQARDEACNCNVILAQESLDNGLKNLLTGLRGGTPRQRLGLESQHLSFHLALQLQSWNNHPEYVPSRDIVEELRCIKETGEIAVLRKAFSIAQRAFSRVRRGMRPGLTELRVAGIFELSLRDQGAEQSAFNTIVASGKRSALPHAATTTKRLSRGEVVLLDFGVRVGGYCSDLTRVHLLPEAPRPEILDVVQEAQDKALERVRPGVLSTDVDKTARDVIARYGYADYFGHGTGHGLGLEVHEGPFLSPHRSCVIQEGMVFTIEPGIYLPGRYGVRIEDAVVVTRDGCQLLSERGL